MTRSAASPSQTLLALTATTSLRDGRPRDRTEWLLRDVEEGVPVDRDTADALVLLNLGLADGIASRYLGRGIDRDDLVQVARLGLVKAVRRFRPGVGQSFVGFAAPTISGEIKRHFRDTGWMVRPPRRLQELGARIRDVEKDLEQDLHRRPRPDELASGPRGRREPGPSRSRGGVELPRPVPGPARQPGTVGPGGESRGVGRPLRGRRRLGVAP